MAHLIVPPIEGDGDWPSLGPQVADWQESTLAFGPGDLLGKPYRLDEEDRALLERAYQVYPPQHTGRCRFDEDGAGWRCSVGNGKCGRRRFDTVVYMLRKGLKKSERAAGVAAVELADDGPVRCDGFRRAGRRWEPIGRPVVSPFVFVFAFAKEQAEDTSFDAMRQMIALGPGVDRFDVWEERILRRDGTGEAKAMASAPDSKDGGKTTFQIKEEPHRWVLPRHHESHQTTRGNLSKRPIAEPWELFPTTAYAPGEGSVAEELHEAARKLTGDAAKTSRMFFYYRWADTKIKIRDDDGEINEEGLRRAIIDASGPIAAKWSDVDGIMALQFQAPGADQAYGERVWLNRTVKRAVSAFDMESWKRNARPARRIPAGAQITLGFDGSRGSVDPKRSPDHTGLIATEIETGFQQKLAHWDPALFESRMIPRHEVDIAVDDAFTRYVVWRMYADPPDWDSEIAAWRAKYGAERVIEWPTYRERPIGFACANYAKAIETGELIHDGDKEFTAHIGHAHRKPVNARDDKGERLWTIQKEREGSQLKIDLGMCGVLSWEARTDAIGAGVMRIETQVSAYETFTSLLA
jgi:hypothetical protein